jgi:hypothetical protein
MIDWLFRNRRTGRITIAQAPNVTLAVFILAWLVNALFHPSGTAHTILVVVQVGALVLWAGDEVVRGVNPWRRILGGSVLAFMAYGWLSSR